jgi:hypothetical protein
LYYECVELDYEIRGDKDDLEGFPPFVFDVYDEDNELMDRTDDYLARAIVYPSDCSISI